MGPTWGPPGTCWPQMGPCWSHELCYQGNHCSLMNITRPYWVDFPSSLEFHLTNNFLQNIFYRHPLDHGVFSVCNRISNISITYRMFNHIRIRDFAHFTHWGRVTRLCGSKIIVIGSDNGLSPGRLQAIIWTSAGILLIEPLGTNVNGIFIKIYIFSFKKMQLKLSSTKWRLFRFGLNELIIPDKWRLGLNKWRQSLGKLFHIKNDKEPSQLKKFKQDLHQLLSLLRHMELDSWRFHLSYHITIQNSRWHFH